MSNFFDMSGHYELRTARGAILDLKMYLEDLEQLDADNDESQVRGTLEQIISLADDVRDNVQSYLDEMDQPTMESIHDSFINGNFKQAKQFIDLGWSMSNFWPEYVSYLRGLYATSEKILAMLFDHMNRLKNL